MLIILLLLFPIFSQSAKLQGSEKAECPGYEDHPLILMSLDGFRPDYLTRGLTPTLQKLMTNGVSVPYMTATFPTVTFPNHYTIVTGLYPESHGIIANYFYDKNYNETFSKYVNSLADGKWFAGEPIWNTVEKNGMVSATYFWVGSEAEIQGIRPTYYYKYSDDVPFEDRIEKVLDWLTLPAEKRPRWISVYFNEPDSAGHDFGPDSKEVNTEIQRVDGVVKSLVTGIDDLGLTECVNLIIVSDHGMAEGGKQRLLHLDEYDSNLEEKSNVYYGAVTRIKMKDEYMDEQIPVMNSLTCQTEQMRQFDQKSLPKRYHFSNNPRIEDIILGLDPGYDTKFESNSFRQGLHGYDNEFVEMQSLFVASGPDFKQIDLVRPFQSIELYNLMCDLLSIEAADNNGTKGALYHIMKNPPSYPDLPLGVTPTIAQFPSDDDIQDLLSTAGCNGDVTSPEDWIYSLDFDEAEQADIRSVHMPFGPPIHDSSMVSNVTVLYQSDHITGFSQTLKMPVWTSFTFNTTPPGNPTSLWSSDVRLSANDSPRCSDYESFDNFSMHPLFHPDYSQNEDLYQIPFMISNSLPMTTELKERYGELMTELIVIWQQLHGGPMNIIAGPVFDNDFNSLVDDIPDSDNGQPWSLTPPSDIFVIATKCRSKDIENLRNCHIEEFEVSAFIYRQTQTISNCMDRDRYAREFSARVKDIELATGLIFYSDLDYKDAINLVLRSQLDIWET